LIRSFLTGQSPEEIRIADIRAGLPKPASNEGAALEQSKPDKSNSAE